MGKDLYLAKQFIDAIPGSAGIITTIAKRVDCDWHTAEKYIKEKPTVARAYADECESIIDMGESSLYQSVKDREAWAVKYLLSTKGKHRGYVERQELTGKDGGAVVIVSWDED